MWCEVNILNRRLIGIGFLDVWGPENLRYLNFDYMAFQWSPSGHQLNILGVLFSDDDNDRCNDTYVDNDGTILMIMMTKMTKNIQLL